MRALVLSLVTSKNMHTEKGQWALVLLSEVIVQVQVGDKSQRPVQWHCWQMQTFASASVASSARDMKGNFNFGASNSKIETLFQRLFVCFQFGSQYFVIRMSIACLGE